jgi:hypothetical protein
VQTLLRNCGTKGQRFLDDLDDLNIQKEQFLPVPCSKKNIQMYIIIFKTSG